jgi:hypothetical protein
MRAPRTSIDARVSAVLGLCGIAILSGCSSGSSSSSTTVDGDVSIAYVKRPVAAVGNPTEAYTFSAGGDLYIREKSSPSAPETNITAAYTKGHGDVSDPEVSYDGTKLLFAMRCEAGASASCLNPDGTGNDTNWRIWEYDISRKTFTRIACTVASGITPPGDDVDPAYLPDGRIVFVSNRQVGSRQHMAEAGQTPFAYLDEYERQRTTALHVMDANGQNCQQISYNQSHDRNPTVLQNGDIMYSRWDHVGGRNQFTIFTTHVDGTELFVKYGAHSNVVSFLHPREMPNGEVISDAMPLSRTHEGGALMMIDINNYSEINEPAPNAPPGGVGQVQPTAHDVNYGRGISRYGRFTTPYPLWDGTNRVLVSWTASCAATNSCVMVTNPLTGAREQSDENTPPVYGVYMFDLGTKSMRPVVIAPPGYAVLDPVAIQPRPVPGAGTTSTVDSTLAGTTSQLNTMGVGILDVQSVYDTDDKQRMGDAVLVSGLGESIPKVTSIPASPAPNQCYVSKLGAADICRLKDPAQTTAAQRPARFIRVTRAVPTQQGISRAAIGETDFEMQQILGYVPVEPDGSFRIAVPADIPLGLTVIDSAGRGFQTHTSWIQVRPGEIRTCHGCHSPRRDNALNVAPNVAGYHSNVLNAMAAANSENMAGTHNRVYGDVSMQLQPNLVYTDIWTDPAKAGRPADAPLTIDYSGVPVAPVNGVIDYETNIAPLWAKQRTLPGGGSGDCTTCHDGSGTGVDGRHALDLRNTTGGAGRQASYDSLLIGDPQLDANGLPVLTVDNGEIRVVESEAQVVPGLARGSHLIEVLFKQELKSAYTLGATDHSAMLNASELRLVSEWIDLGAQYYNSPRDSNGDLRGVTGMDQGVFDNSIHAILLNRCGSCHQPVGVAGTPAGTPNVNFVGRRFVLTGDPEGDFNVTLSMVGDRSQPAMTELLRRPASTGTNPTHGTLPGGGAILLTTDPDYVAVCSWISLAGTCP